MGKEGKRLQSSAKGDRTAEKRKTKRKPVLWEKKKKAVFKKPNLYERATPKGE